MVQNLQDENGKCCGLKCKKLWGFTILHGMGENVMRASIARSVGLYTTISVKSLYTYIIYITIQKSSLQKPRFEKIPGIEI